MNKPNNYDNTRTESFERIAVGPHVAIIKAVDEQKSKTGKDMIVVSIDFAKNDQQAGYFTREFDNDQREEKKWPFQATQYILVNTPEGNTSRSFKSFCTSFENSNNVEIVWGEAFCKQFKGKKIGVMYGEVEEEYNGQTNIKPRIRWFFDVHKIDEQVTPSTKYLEKQAAPQGDEWMNVPETGKEELPFA